MDTENETCGVNAETRVMDRPEGASDQRSSRPVLRARTGLPGLLRRTGLDIAYLAASLLTSVLAFVVWVTGLTVTATLILFIVGFIVVIGTAWLFRLTAGLDRRLARLARGEVIEAIYRRPAELGVIPRIRCVLTDPQTWKDLAWLVLHSVIGFGLSLLALTALAVWLGMLLQPAWYWALPGSDPVDYGIYQVSSAGLALASSAIAVVLTPLAWALLRGSTLAISALAKTLLGPSENQRLRARVDQLAATRDDAGEISREQLERIERDLHDGAQARLVSVAMELGMADQAMSDAPDEAREPIRRARTNTLEALEELRSLARGMRPALLSERGLATAVEALAERSPIPVTLELSGPVGEVPEAVESVAYFVIAEALANAGKHSDAERVRITIRRGPDVLVMTVSDDGHGGADPSGSGLAGLRKRVGTVDGRLELASPQGGPTELAAELPCPELPS